MKRQKFSREYKLEAVKQVRERGVSSAQVARGLGIGANVVAVVLDLHSGRVVGWSMQATMAAQLVNDAMLMAIWRRRPSSELLHHSDRR
jgi:hypothetical protein